MLGQAQKEDVKTKKDRSSAEMQEALNLFDVIELAGEDETDKYHKAVEKYNVRHDTHTSNESGVILPQESPSNDSSQTSFFSIDEKQDDYNDDKVVEINNMKMEENPEEKKEVKIEKNKKDSTILLILDYFLFLCSMGLLIAIVVLAFCQKLNETRLWVMLPIAILSYLLSLFIFLKFRKNKRKEVIIIEKEPEPIEEIPAWKVSYENYFKETYLGGNEKDDEKDVKLNTI